MKIFDKRPLCMILVFLLCGFVVFSISAVAMRIALIAIASAVFFIGILVRSYTKNERFCIIAVAVVMLLGILLSFLYFDIWFRADKRFSDDEVLIEGEVISIDNGRYLGVKTNKICNHFVIMCKMTIKIPQFVKQVKRAL
jgi:hypothetical protein